MKSILIVSLIATFLVAGGCVTAPAKDGHRVLLQVRAGAGGGNPNRIDMEGQTSIYIDEVVNDVISFDEPISMNDRAVAHITGAVVPFGKKFIVTKVIYHGTSVGDSNGHGEFLLNIGDTIIAHSTDSNEQSEGVWRGRIEIESGDERAVFLEVANSSSGSAEVLGYLVASDKVQAPIVLPPVDLLDSNLQSAELLSRRKYRDYERCTFSFIHGLRDDPDLSITHNNWDLQFGNGGDYFNVTMVTDDRSKLVDLGEMTWAELNQAGFTIPEPYPVPSRSDKLPVLVGHIYLVRSVDRDSDHTSLLRVENLVPGDRVNFSWYLHSSSPVAPR